MAMKPVTENWRKARMTEDARGLRGQRVFVVEAASEIDAKIVLQTQTGIARKSVYKNAYGESPDPQVTYNQLDVTPLTPAPLGGTGLYEVICPYSKFDSEFVRPGPSPGGPPSYRFSDALTAEPIDTDIYKNPILNGKRAPFQPNPTALFPKLSLVVEWYQTAVNLASFLTYRRKVNSNTWQVGQYGSVNPGQAFCRSVIPQQEGTHLFRVSASFDLDADGFQLEVQNLDVSTTTGDRRLNALGGPFGTTTAGKDSAGATITSQPSGAEIVTTAAGMRFRYTIYDSIDFSGLGI